MSQRNKIIEKKVVEKEKEIDQNQEEKSTEPEKWVKPVMAESDVFLYCMDEG